MNRRIFAAVLAAALALSLTACGGGNNGGGSSSNPGSSSDVSTMAPGGSSSDPSDPDGSQPDPSAPDGSQPDGSAGGASSSADSGSSDSSSSGSSSSQGASISLNRTDVTLKTAGASFNLRYTAEPSGIEAFFSSSDETVATVDGKGTVTAVAPGTATITVTLGSELIEATCIVRCRWEETPSGGGSSSSGSSSGSGSSSASTADLQAFYDATLGKYQFSFMMEADDAMLDNFFAGLSDLSLSQQILYLCGMSPSPHGDFALIQVSNSKDADTVKSILQARIDYMVGDGNGPGGAFYPMEQTMWEENSRIAVNGDYVMLIVHPDCDSIVKDFNALF